MAKVVKESIKELEVGDYPNTLYKYRVWSNECHRKIITDREVYLAAPSSFEDPLDCKFPIRWDLLTDEQIWTKYYTNSKEQNLLWNEEQHISFANEWLKKTPIKDKNFIDSQTKKDFEDYDNRIGVLSLTEYPELDEMWDKYSESGKGFCIGFDTKVLFDYMGGGGKVEYVDKIPVILPMPFHSFHQQRFLQIFNKMDTWDFEQEYRTIIFDKNELTSETRKRILPPEAYREVLLGMKVEKKHEDEIRDLLKSEMSHVSVRKVE